MFLFPEIHGKNCSSLPGLCHTIRHWWTLVSLSAPDGSGQCVASSHGSHTVCWQPIPGGSRPAQQTNHPYDTNPANQQNVTLSDIGDPCLIDGSDQGVAHTVCRSCPTRRIQAANTLRGIRVGCYHRNGRRVGVPKNAMNGKKKLDNESTY